MSLEIRAYQSSDHDALMALVNDPSIVDQFEKIAGPSGVRDLLEEPVIEPAGIRIGRLDGRPVAFAITYVLPQSSGGFAMQRVAVLEPHRRRGVGLALLRASEHYLGVQTRAPGLVDAGFSAWLPNPGAEALAARAGYVHRRYYWMMQRPRSPIAPPAWPEGVTTEHFDRSQRHHRDWNDAYNDSFAKHHLFLPSTLEHAQQLAKHEDFRADGLLLAYRDGKCLGFCRNELYPARGEVGTLATITTARGIGLGRALLRWGVDWLQTHTELPVTLIVDGENETAMRLYQNEGFQVSRTRRIWGRRLEPA